MHLDLSQAVDVYSDWLDECEKANQGGGQASSTPVARSSSSTSVSQSQSYADDDDDQDDE